MQKLLLFFATGDLSRLLGYSLHYSNGFFVLYVLSDNCVVVEKMTHLVMPSISYHAYTACVNKSASLKEHFFLGKLYVTFENVYNNMIGNIICFCRIFVLCNLNVWFRNYGKSCEVPPNLLV